MSNFCLKLKDLLKDKNFKLYEKKYLEFLHRGDCIACFLGKDSEIKNPLKRKIIAHHENLSYCFRGYKRVTDFSAITLCEFHHQKRHNEGFFIYERWFGDSSLVYLVNFSLLAEFFREEGFVSLADKIEKCKGEINEKLLTNSKLFDRMLLWIGENLLDQ